MEASEIIKDLSNLEAWADGLKKEATRIRKAIQAGVSTQAKNRQVLTDGQIAEILQKRRKQKINSAISKQ